MNAAEALKLLEDNDLAFKETFKLCRKLNLTVTQVLASDIGADMWERDPELFGPLKVRTQTDENGFAGEFVWPWDEGYNDPGTIEFTSQSV